MVLVVDDDPDLRDAVVYYLKVIGMDAVGAAEGREALALLQRGLPICLILLDMRMPGMDGWQFREAQLRDPRIAHIPAVMFSAEAAIDARARRLGLEEHLTKPGDPERVTELVHRRCARNH